MTKRKTKKIYLIRETRELWGRVLAGRYLLAKDIAAHCLRFHDLWFQEKQIYDALWSFHAELRNQSGKFKAIPYKTNGKFIGLQKIFRDAEGKAKREEYEKLSVEKLKKIQETKVQEISQDKEDGFLNKEKAVELLITLQIPAKEKEKELIGHEQLRFKEAT